MGKTTRKTRDASDQTSGLHPFARLFREQKRSEMGIACDPFDRARPGVYLVIQRARPANSILDSRASGFAM